jgi:hypothetical protein
MANLGGATNEETKLSAIKKSFCLPQNTKYVSTNSYASLSLYGGIDIDYCKCDNNSSQQVHIYITVYLPTHCRFDVRQFALIDAVLAAAVVTEENTTGDPLYALVHYALVL